MRRTFVATLPDLQRMEALKDAGLTNFLHGALEAREEVTPSNINIPCP
jgi:hypothetical protein